MSRACLGTLVAAASTARAPTSRRHPRQPPGWRDPRLWVGVVPRRRLGRRGRAHPRRRRRLTCGLGGRRRPGAGRRSPPTTWWRPGALRRRRRPDRYLGVDDELPGRRSRSPARWRPASWCRPAALGAQEDDDTVSAVDRRRHRAVPTDLGPRLARRRVGRSAEDRAAPRRRGRRARARRRRGHRRPVGRPIASRRRPAGSWCWRSREDDDGVARRGRSPPRRRPRPRRRAGADAVICVLLLAAGAAWESPALAASTAHPASWCSSGASTSTTCSRRPPAARPTWRWSGSTPRASTRRRRPPAPHAVRPVAVTSARPDDLDVPRARASASASRRWSAGGDLGDAARGGDHGRGRRRHPRRAADAPVAPPATACPRPTPGGWSSCGARPAPRGVRPSPTNLAWELARRGCARRAGRRSTPTAARWPSSSASSTRSPGCSPPPAWPRSGQLDERFASVCRGVGDHLAVVTGLPRADRWARCAAAQVDQLLERARELGEVVVDTGFSLEDEPGSDFGGRPGRNALTLARSTSPTRWSWSAPPTRSAWPGWPAGWSTCATGPEARRCASWSTGCGRSIGWSEREIAGMVEGFSRVAGLHFLPEDRPAVDRALVAGRPLAEVGDSSLVRALGALADARRSRRTPVGRRGPTGDRLRGRRSAARAGERSDVDVRQVKMARF